MNTKYIPVNETLLYHEINTRLYQEAFSESQKLITHDLRSFINLESHTHIGYAFSIP